MIEVWIYDKTKTSLFESEVMDLIKNGLTTTNEETISQYMKPWSTTYKDKKDAKENCPYSKKRGYAVLYKNLKTGKFTK